MTKLLKTPMHGGMLMLTEREIMVGEGWLGAQNVRRFSLQSLAQLELLPSTGQSVLRRSVLLRFVWADGQTTDVSGVGPAAAQRVRDLIQSLCPLVSSNRHG
jgi:hypothetical protein